MKQKFANYLKFGILLFGISLFMHSCQNDEHIAQDEHSSLKKGRIENYSKLNTFVDKLKEKPNAAVDDKATSLETTNGFDIIYDQDMYIQELDGAETYSIPIYKKNQLGGTFSNLIVRFSDTEETEAFILNYDPDDEYIAAIATDEQIPFVGNISSEPVNYDGSLDNLKSNGGCYTITTKYCDYDEGEHGDVHLGGDNCTPGYYWYVTTTICFGDELPQLVDVPLPGGGNPSATDYITAGNSPSGNETNLPIVVPNVPRTHTSLDIDSMSFEMTDWLNQSENIEFKEEMMDFLNEERHIEDTELEAYLMIKSESSSIAWENYSGTYNNIQSLQYTHLRHITDYTRGYTYTEFKLPNGDIILHGDFARTIDESGISYQTEPDIRTYYYSKVSKRLFKIPEPYNEPENIDLNQLWSEFWGAAQTGIRYCTPLEDFIILIDGKDFDGVEQSRAVAGLSIIIDNIPFGKAFKIVKKAGQTIDASIPIIRRFTTNIYKAQRRLVKQYRGIIANASTLRKGNFGEMATDVDLIGKGYQDLHVNRITDIDTPTSQGIDHVFKNPETGQYIIVESKYGSSSLSTLVDGTRQMSDDWILSNNRLFNVIGQNQNLYDDILDNGYLRVVARVSPDGTVVYKKLHPNGYQILGDDGVFTP